MKYRVPHLGTAPDEELWIADADDSRLIRIETVPHGRALALVLRAPDGDPLAAVHPQRAFTGTAVEVEVAGGPFARLTRKGPGAVAVRAHAGAYTIAGDFAAWDFHVLLNTSPVADVSPRRTGGDAYLVETSDNEPQLPLLAIVLAVDLLVQARC